VLDRGDKAFLGKRKGAGRMGLRALLVFWQGPISERSAACRGEQALSVFDLCEGDFDGIAGFSGTGFVGGFDFYAEVTGGGLVGDLFHRSLMRIRKISK